MALGDLTTASCSGGAAAAPLSTLATRLAERATGNIAAPPTEQAEPLDINSLRNGLPRHHQQQRQQIPPPPLPPRQFAPPPPRFLPVPQPDGNATTARFERAFARALPHPQNQRQNSTRSGPTRHIPHNHVHHPNTTMGWRPQVPYMYGAPIHPPMPHHHQMPPFMAPSYITHSSRTVQTQQPVQPQTAVLEQQQQQSPTQTPDSDALYAQVVRMLREERPDNLNNAAALGLLARAQESWGDGFTGLDGFEDDDRENTSGLDNYENDLLSLGVTDPANEPYRFTDRNQNQYNGLGAAEALAEGIRLRNEGQLARALLSFEAALNRPAIDPSPPLTTGERMRAWYLLGVTLAECDDDARAIQALSRVVSEDNEGGGGPSSRDSENHPLVLAAQAALALAVSYVNELDISRATAELWRWLRLRGEMRGDPPIEQSAPVAGEDSVEAGIVQALEEAAQRHDGADIQLALGVAHNAMRDYDRAAIALRRAVAERENDARLWNRLGATLANGGRSEEALRAYRRAVDLCPLYVRAWVNVGTAYANNNEFDRAARYYVRALVMVRDQGTNNEPNLRTTAGTARHVEMDTEHVWGYLRSTLLSLGEKDLLGACERGDLDEIRSRLQF